MAELWDAYDKHFQRIENVTLIRDEVIPDGMYHLVGEVIVKHADGTFLLMQRDFRKRLGGLWELSVSGSALQGETALECAMRELREETGIVAGSLTELKRIVSATRPSLYVIFICYTDCDKDSIILQDGETIAYQWAEKHTILNMDSNELASTRTIEILKTMNL